MWLRTSLVAFAVLASTSAFAEGPRLADLKDVDVSAFAQELMRQSAEDREVKISLWLPGTYWRVSAAKSSGLTEDGMRRVEEALSPYLLLAVASGEVGPFGGVSWASEGRMRETVTVIDAKGAVIAPLSPDGVSADAQNLRGMLRPIFTGMLGPLGENLHLLFFPAESPDGAPLGDATREGSFAVHIGESRFDYRLPLSVLLKPRRCPIDDEAFSGAWKFCPFHGQELKPAD